VTDADARNYFERRAEEERTAAEQAADARAAQSHRELARHYSSLAQASVVQRTDKAQPLEPGTMPSDFRILP